MRIEGREALGYIGGAVLIAAGIVSIAIAALRLHYTPIEGEPIPWFVQDFSEDGAIGALVGGASSALIGGSLIRGVNKAYSPEVHYTNPSRVTSVHELLMEEV